ncbi:FMN phosphatase YigB (HAD superfamily) [Pedobacter sp. UYP30]|uniref:HAD family hydrolase n=1 Tax=Pedobacter sp. UYP30 TaxID=1756400 RepID=UPI00339A77EC
MQKIKNVIFDFGNVIFEIDFKKAQQSFADLGVTNVDDFFAHKGHTTLFDDLETAKISPAEFRAGIREKANTPNLSDAQIDQAWNNLLIGSFEENHRVLLKMGEKYRTFLLSNSNVIHYDWIMDYIKKEFHLENYDEYFEKVYFSQQLKLRKPNREIFEYVLKENNLLPAETLFIDDSPQHLEGAKKLGLQTLLMTEHPSKLGSFLKLKGLL